MKAYKNIIGTVFKWKGVPSIVIGHSGDGMNDWFEVQSLKDLRAPVQVVSAMDSQFMDALLDIPVHSYDEDVHTSDEFIPKQEIVTRFWLGEFDVDGDTVYAIRFQRVKADEINLYGQLSPEEYQQLMTADLELMDRYELLDRVTNHLICCDFNHIRHGFTLHHLNRDWVVSQ